MTVSYSKAAQSIEQRYPGRRIIRISEIVAKPHLAHFSDRTTLHQIDKGGRSSCKSSKNEVKIPYLFLQDPTAECAVVRAAYKDHRDTTFAGLRIGFSRLGWELTPERDYPTGKTSPMFVKTPQGNYVHFVGLNDYESMKGARPTREGNQIKILWLFEITQFASKFDMDNVIANFIRGSKDWFIILYEFNPPPKKTHWVYEWLETMKDRPDAYIQHTNYNDLPEQQQKEWLGEIALQEIDAMKEIDYEQYRSIYLGLPANLSGTVYKKFDERVHVRPCNETADRFVKVEIGVDYGETDATAFTLCGILYGVEGIRFPAQYWHKNNVTTGDKGIEEYANDFFEFAEKAYNRYRKIMIVYVDSAAKYFWSYLQKERARRGINYVIIQPTDKTAKSGNKYESVIEERIGVMNLMLGSRNTNGDPFVVIDPSCKHLISAIIECERDQNGNRRDDGTTDIDSLDSAEYSWNEDIPAIEAAVLRQRGFRPAAQVIQQLDVRESRHGTDLRTPSQRI